MIDQVMTINSVQKSSKSELSSWGNRPFKALLMHRKNIEIFQIRFFPPMFRVIFESNFNSNVFRRATSKAKYYEEADFEP